MKIFISLNIFVFIERINLLYPNSLFKLLKIRSFVLYQSHRNWQHLPKTEIIKHPTQALPKYGVKSKDGDSAIYLSLLFLLKSLWKLKINECKQINRFMQTLLIRFQIFIHLLVLLHILQDVLLSDKKSQELVKKTTIIIWYFILESY